MKYLIVALFLATSLSTFAEEPSSQVGEVKEGDSKCVGCEEKAKAKMNQSSGIKNPATAVKPNGSKTGAQGTRR